MLTERRDYLLRLIQQAGAAARRLRELLTEEGVDGDEVAREADQAIGALLGGGPQAQLLERVDADTAVRLLSDPERVRVWVDLLRAQSDALRRSGADAQAQRVQDRAAALAAAAARLAESLGN
ncbi:MAG: hypothetical protein ACT4P6_13405 [Gemmatimonadaceae bacterium]